MLGRLRMLKYATHASWGANRLLEPSRRVSAPDSAPSGFLEVAEPFRSTAPILRLWPSGPQGTRSLETWPDGTSRRPKAQRPINAAFRHYPAAPFGRTPERAVLDSKVFMFSRFIHLPTLIACGMVGLGCGAVESPAPPDPSPLESGSDIFLIPDTRTLERTVPRRATLASLLKSHALQDESYRERRRPNLLNQATSACS